MSQKNNYEDKCKSKYKDKNELPNVRDLDEQELFQVILRPETNFMPQHIRDFLRQAKKEYDRRWQLKKEAREKRKRGPREKPDPKLLAKYKQEKLSF